MSILKGVKDEISVKVTAEIDSDNGTTIRVPFVIRSRKPMQDERKAVLKRIADGEIEDDALVADYLLDWSNLKGADGSDVAYNEANLQEVLQAPEYRSAVVGGIVSAIVGKAALAKNS